MSTLEVGGPDICGQAVLGVVGQLECCFLGGERGDGTDRAEAFVLDNSVDPVRLSAVPKTSVDPKVLGLQA